MTGLGLRVTREQVEDIALCDELDCETLDDLCRDWLDMERVVEAARAAGPWPRITFTRTLYGPRYTCQHCYVHAHAREVLRHMLGCPGERMADALSALDASRTEDGDAE